MTKRKEFLPFLLLGLVSFMCIVLTFFYVDPEVNFYTVPPVIILFVFIFLSVFGISTFLTRNMRRGLLLGFFITTLLILQVTGFANIFYIVILLLIVLVLDLGLKKR